MADFQVLGIGQPAPKKPLLRPSHYHPPSTAVPPLCLFSDSTLPIDVRSLTSVYLNDNPQFQELRQRLVDYYRDSLKPVSVMHRDKSQQWRIVLYTSLHKLLREVVSAHDKPSQESCLTRVYHWYYDKIHRPPPKPLSYSPLSTNRLSTTARSLSPAPAVPPKNSGNRREASLTGVNTLRPATSLQRTMPVMAEDREDVGAFTGGGDPSMEQRRDCGSTFVHYVPMDTQEDIHAENRLQSILLSTQATNRDLTAMRSHVHTWTTLKARHEEELTLRTERPRLLAQRPATSLPKLNKAKKQLNQSPIRSITPGPTVINLQQDPGREEEAVTVSTTSESVLNFPNQSDKVSRARVFYGKLIDSKDSFTASQQRTLENRGETKLLSGYTRRAVEGEKARSGSVPRSRPVLTGGLSIPPRPLSEERVSQLEEVGEVKSRLARFGVPCRYESLTTALLIPEDLPAYRLTPDYFPKSGQRMMKNPFLTLREKKKKKGKRGKQRKGT